MYQKYALGLPLARQEEDWYRLGLVLSRNDMANRIIRCSQEWLEPVYGRILEKLREHCEVLHMDETRAAFFHYAKSRNGDTAAQLLSGFHGYLKYLLTKMPNNHHLEHPEIIDRYLPWSAELPEECRLKHKNTKCLKK